MGGIAARGAIIFTGTTTDLFMWVTIIRVDPTDTALTLASVTVATVRFPIYRRSG